MAREEKVGKLLESIAFDALTADQIVDEVGLISHLINCHIKRFKLEPIVPTDYTDSHVDALTEEVLRLKEYVDEQRQTLQSFQNKL